MCCAFTSAQPHAKNVSSLELYRATRIQIARKTRSWKKHRILNAARNGIILAMSEATAILENLSSKLTPEVRSDLDAVIGLQLGDEHYTIDARKDGGAGLLPGAPAVHGLEPRLGVATSSADFLKLVSGELNPMMAAMSGKLKLTGDMGFAFKLTSLFG